MATLQAPLLPQRTNGIITTDQITAAGGVLVQVPLYNNVEVNDTIDLYWNNNFRESYRVLSVTDLPRIFTIPVQATVIGNNSVYYSSTDSVGNMSWSPIETVNITQSIVQPNYTLTSLIIDNNIPVNNASGNIILYTLRNQSGAPVSGSYLLFSATSNVTFIPTYGVTNADGQFVLHVTSALSGGVLITATATTTPEVKNYTEINFTAVIVNYSLTASITTNNAAANGTATNVVKATLINLATGQGVPGQTLLISTNGQANHPVQVTTDNYGNANIALSTYVSGNLTVTIRLQSNTSVYTTITVTFSASNPNLQGPLRRSIKKEWSGLQDILAGFTLRRSHNYQIYYSPNTVTGVTVDSCVVGRVYEGNLCYLSNANATLVGNTNVDLIRRFNVLSNAPETFDGSELRSRGYVYRTTQQSDVDVYLEDITAGTLSTDDISLLESGLLSSPDNTIEPVAPKESAHKDQDENPDVV